MHYLGEWNVEVWVRDDLSDDEAERFLDEFANMLSTWASGITRTPSGVRIARTKISR